MKNLHRMKALEAYAGARLVLKEGMVYPSYMLLKEAVRSTLAYISEDMWDREYSEKSKMHKLLSDMPAGVLSEQDESLFELFCEMDKVGLEGILYLDIEKLREIKKAVKKLISVYLRVDL